MNPRPVVLRAVEPSLKRQIILGKIDRTPDGIWVYRLDTTRKAQMRALKAWGIAPCVLAYMRVHGVETIHIKVKGETGVLEATLRDVAQRSIVDGYGKRSVHYHLPEDRFRRRPEPEMGFVTDTVVLDWDVRPALSAIPLEPEQLRLL